MDEPLTDEEIASLQKTAAEDKLKVEELEKGKGESDVKLKEYEEAKTKWETEKKELEESSNPNWQKTRARISSLESALKDKGVELNDDGTVKSNPQNVDVEELLKKATQAGQDAATNTMLGGRLDEILAGYETKSKEVIKVYYDKLTAGETVTLKNIQEFVDQAEQAASVNPENKINKISSYTGGQGPRTADINTLDDSSMQSMGEKLGLGFAKPKVKK